MSWDIMSRDKMSPDQAAQHKTRFAKQFSNFIFLSISFEHFSTNNDEDDYDYDDVLVTIVKKSEREICSSITNEYFIPITLFTKN